METRASYLLVGSFVLVLLLGALGFVVWLAKFNTETDLVRYEMIFTDAVTGLSVASPVRYAGVRVGEVQDVRLDPERPEQVQVIIEVEAQAPVTAETVGSLEFEGLAGGRYVLLEGGEVGAAPPAVEPGRRYPRIPTKSSAISQVLEGAPNLIAAAERVLDRVELMLDERNLTALANTLSNLESVTGTVAARSGDIDQLLEDAASTMDNISRSTGQLAEMATELRADADTIVSSTTRTLGALERLADNLDKAVATNDTELQRTLGEVRAAAGSIGALAGEVQALVAENREPLRDFTASGLYELAGLLNQMRTLVSSLTSVTSAVERDPARFLFGNSQEGYETSR